MSRLSILHKNKPLATVVRYNSALLLFRGSLLTTLKRFLVAGIVTAWDFSIFIRNSSMLFFTCFRISIFTSPFVVYYKKEK